MSPSYRRSIRALLNGWLDFLIAGALLYYCDIRWFYLFCLAEWIACSFRWKDELRSQIRVSLISIECKLLAIMKHLDIDEQETGISYDKRLRDTMSEKAYIELLKDFVSAGIKLT